MSLDVRGRWASKGRRFLLVVLRSISATEIADACGVTPAAISALATGVTREPSLRLAYRLRVFGIDPEAWLDEPDEPETISTPIEASRVMVLRTKRAATRA